MDHLIVFTIRVGASVDQATLFRVPMDGYISELHVSAPLADTNTQFKLQFGKEESNGNIESWSTIYGTQLVVGPNRKFDTAKMTIPVVANSVYRVWWTEPLNFTATYQLILVDSKV